jgi:hypothetical protein
MNQLPEGRPLTKALHTTRIIGRLARLWCELRTQQSQGLPAEPEAAAFLFALVTIGNAPPADPALRDECIEACKRAIIEWRGEREQMRRRMVA